MRFRIFTLSFVAAAFGLGASQANAASCSAFITIKSFDEKASTVEVAYASGSMAKFFPKPEGAPRDSTKIPGSCKGNVTKNKSLVVKGSGGRMSITQVRTNYEGKMLNNPDDAAWLPAKLKELIGAKTEVVAVIRPGMAKDSPLGITTLYLPAGPEDLAEIKRIEDQGEDVE
jgi:hypothetical protein